MANRNREQGGEFERLRGIVARLRSEEGCPWDRAQTHESLKAACMEEAAEVIGGISILTATKDGENLKEELGDMLFQVMLQAQIAQEEGLFTIDDVLCQVSEKMIRRHPHVFGEGNQEPADWEEIKKQEKDGREWEKDYLPAAMEEALSLIERAKRRKGF